jgi:hypothetical protein
MPHDFSSAARRLGITVPCLEICNCNGLVLLDSSGYVAGRREADPTQRKQQVGACVVWWTLHVCMSATQQDPLTCAPDTLKSTRVSLYGKILPSCSVVMLPAGRPARMAPPLTRHTSAMGRVVRRASPLGQMRRQTRRRGCRCRSETYQHAWNTGAGPVR